MWDCERDTNGEGEEKKREQATVRDQERPREERESENQHQERDQSKSIGESEGGKRVRRKANTLRSLASSILTLANSSDSLLCVFCFSSQWKMN